MKTITAFVLFFFATLSLAAHAEPATQNDQAKAPENKPMMYNYKTGKNEEIDKPLTISWEKAREFVPQEEELLKMMDFYQNHGSMKPIKASIKTLAIYLEAAIEKQFEGIKGEEAKKVKADLLEKIGNMMSVDK